MRRAFGPWDFYLGWYDGARLARILRVLGDTRDLGKLRNFISCG